MSFGIGINAKFAVIVDRFGNVYLYLGGDIGIKGLSGSLTHGWVQKGYSAQDLEIVAVDEAQLESLLSGWSMSAGGGAGVGASFVGPFGEQNRGYALTEAGLYCPPQAGAGGGYSFRVYDNGRRTSKMDKPNLLNSRFEYWYQYYFSQ